MTTNIFQTSLKLLLGLILLMTTGIVIADNVGKKEGNVIVKCAESIGISFNEQGQFVSTISDDIAGFTPTVVMIESTFGEPDSCQADLQADSIAFCGECLNDLINTYGCRADQAYPGSPLVIHNSSEPIVGGGPNDVLFLSITEYVFQCSRNVAED